MIVPALYAALCSIAAAGASPAAPPFVVALALQPVVGVADADAAAATADLERQLLAELQALGVSARATDALDTECAGDAACMSTTRSALSAQLGVNIDALIVVEVIRAGPVLQVAAAGSGAGAPATGMHSVDDVQQRGGVLPPSIVAWLKVQLPAARPPTAPPAGALVQQTATPPTDDGFTLPAAAIAGVGVAAVGLAAIVGGGALALTREPVLNDPASSGADKASAVMLGRVGLLVGGAGLVATAAGVTLFVVETVE